MSAGVRGRGIRDRVHGRVGALGVALVDVALILAFVVLGEIRHGVDPVAHSGRVVATALPFAVGWLVAATLAGLFRRGLGPREAAVRAGIAWVAAAVVGVGLRATPLAPGGFDVAFLLVSIAVGLVLLVPWRAAVATRRERAA